VRARNVSEPGSARRRGRRGSCYASAVTGPAHHVDYSYKDYLALEAASTTKHEYLGGQIFGMAGGTPEHAAISAAVVALLFRQLRGSRCRVHGSDLRVRVTATGLATYPDVTVVCGPRELHPEDNNAMCNLTLVVEVLSPGTASYDRGDKFEHYKQMPSLRQYVLVGCPERRVEVMTRQENGTWTAREVGDGGVASLPSVGAALDVRDLYDATAEPAS
jgi:Uma2 family endonuclease